MKPGDIVSVESGRYRGCILTFCGVDRLGWAVCLNSNEPGGYVRVRTVAFLRAGRTAEELAQADPVLRRAFETQLAAARRVCVDKE